MMNMKEYRLLIVDSDVDFANRTANFFSRISGFRAVGNASDGASALKMLKTVRPDVILLDSLLHGVDGLSLMKVIQKMKAPPIVVCISEAYTSVGIELARRNGASYYVYKPIELESLAVVLKECCIAVTQRQRIETVREEISDGSELSRRIHDLLHEHGFSFRLNGSEYIAKSVEIAKESPMMLHNLSSGIYQKIADEMRISPACVERNMRTAIAFADSNGFLTEKIGSAPTNKTCIRYLLSVLES